MIIRVFNTMETKNVSEYRTTQIYCNDEFDEDIQNSIKDNGCPMLCFCTDDGRNMCIPVELIISITEEEK